MTNWTTEPQPFGPNRQPLLTGLSAIDGKTPVPVSVDPATGKLQVSSSGGGGGADTQYTDGSLAPTHPIGNALTYSNGTNMLAVSSSNPLPVTGGGGGTQYTDAATPPLHPVGPTLLWDNGGTNWSAVGSTYPLPVQSTQLPPTLGQQSMAASLPVAVASDQTLPLPTNAAMENGGNLETAAARVAPLVTPTAGGYIRQDSTATIAKETGGNLATIATNTTGIATAANQTTTNSSLSTIATNTTGLATSANQTSGNQQTKVTDGTNIINVLKSDGTATGQNAVLTAAGYLSAAFTTTTAQAIGTTDAGNYRWVTVQISNQGTSSNVNFQGSDDNTTWFAVTLTALDSPSGLAQTSSTSTSHIWGGAIPRYFRLNVTGISAGTTSGTMVFSTAPGTNSVQAVFSSNATGIGVPSNAFYAAGQARTSLPTAATSGNLVGAMYDKFGRQVTIPQTTRDLVGVATITITSSTSPATLIAAAGAGVFTDILDVRIVNTSAAATEVTLSDGTNTYEYYAPAGDMRGITLQVPDPATTANTAWTATTITSVASVKITVKYVKNQ